MDTYSKLDSDAILSTLFPPTDKTKNTSSDSGISVHLHPSCSCRLFYQDKENPVFLSFLPEESKMFAETLIQNGINIFMITVNPYNPKKGQPTITALMSSLSKILEKIKECMADNKLTGKLFVNAKSIGSAFALELASNFPDEFKGVILESSVCDTIPFLEAAGVEKDNLGFSEDEGFNNLKKIEKIKLPTMFLHGSRDTLVAPALAEKLQASSGARTKQFHLVPGADHWSVAEAAGDLYYQTIKIFVDSVCGINTWRQRRRKFRKS
ncbi:alpha/beta hydrolase [Desulfomarina profundi]|nr:alpha/beta hydrolase [Desulfomarina profundi]